MQTGMGLTRTEKMKEILASLSNGDGEVCQHPALINKNLCAVCKESVNFNVPTTLPFGYLFRDLSLSVDAIRHLRDLYFDKLLQRNRLHLVLDLDNTLVHGIEIKNKNTVKKKKNNHKKTSSSSSLASNDANDANDDDVYKILKGSTSVKLRPGVRDFLNNAAELFDLSVYTMAEGSYAKEIAKILETDSVHFTSVISKEYSSNKNGKSLDIVLSHQQVTLIVDDLADIWASEDQGNVVKIQPYIFFEKGVAPPSENDDQELARVWRILKNVHTKFFDNKKNQKNYAAKDVRQLLRKN